jgi:hypothetical protein
MSEEPIERRELSPFEEALASLVPLANSRGRDELMFLAGRQSAQREPTAIHRSRFHNAWPLATAASLLIALASVWWGVQKPVQVVERVVRVTQPANQESLGGANRQQHDETVAPARPARSHLASAGWQNATGEARAYLRLRDQVVARGFESLPPPTEQENDMGHASSSFSEIRNRFLKSARQAY